MSWAPPVCHAPAVAASPHTASACAAGAHTPAVHTASAHIPRACRGHVLMHTELSAPFSPRREGYMGACAPLMCPLGGCASLWIAGLNVQGAHRPLEPCPGTRRAQDEPGKGGGAAEGLSSSGWGPRGWSGWVPHPWVMRGGVLSTGPWVPAVTLPSSPRPARAADALRRSPGTWGPVTCPVCHPSPVWAGRGHLPPSPGAHRFWDGTQHQGGAGDSCARVPAVPCRCCPPQMVQSLGFAVYRALDWGLDENEERELSPRLEQLIDLMTNSDSEDSGCATADEGYGGQEEEEEGGEGPPRSVRTFGQAMRCCAARLADPAGAPGHYQAVCRALFAETVELMAFLAKIRDAKELLQKLKEDEEEEERPAAELGNLRNTDWARLWVQLMRELRHGVKLKKVQEKQFNPLPTEYQLTPFEMLMQDIRARNYKLRKVMVDGDIPPRVKKDAHELILDFIRSRPPLKQASERRLRPLPQKQRTLHEKILEEIRQERKLRPVEQKGYSSLPCIPHACAGRLSSSSCLELSRCPASTVPTRPRPRILLKAPTLAEMEEMNLSEDEDSPGTEVPLKRDRSFSEQDLAQLQSQLGGDQPVPRDPEPLQPEPRPRSGSVPASCHPLPVGPALPRAALGAVEERPEDGSSTAPASSSKHLWLEFSHPVESLALTVEEMINVRRVLVKAEMEKFLQSKELYSSLRRGKVCCCCRAKFPLFSWPTSCFFCKRSVCSSCSLKMKMPSKKLAHIPVYALGFESLPGSLLPKAPPLRRREPFQARSCATSALTAPASSRTW
ncbi:protein spire homolog 2 isoform X2 [Serinus canaria]|uniref:protein spire homolog 2 isoform X2 n=1 Tax=Serinus canaria TaxID=9135 RepID=UPI0021CCBD89|nr:protein spire homolog 2 isoform X2 [Serinus canaria]